MAFCTPFGYRVAPRRHLPAVGPSFFPSSSVFAPSAVSADIGSLFRIFDELDGVSRGSQRQQHQRRQQARAWQPRFDVREEQDAFHLQGDLPGVAQNELNIEFTGPNTLAVSGTTVREHQAGSQPDALPASASTETQDNTASNAEAADVAANQQQEQQEQQQPERPVSPASSASSHSSNYQRPSVEEERDEDDEWTEAVPTPATTNTANTVTATETAKPAASEEQPQQAEDKQVEQQQQQQQQQQGRYWVSERSVGSFKRTFNFPGQIDQDAVTASLKDGVLSITVPKQRTQLRKISVQ